MIKNFIWDFDGTIFDSYPHSARAFCMTLDKYKIAYDAEQVYKDLRITFNYAFEKYGLDENQIADFRMTVKDYNLTPLIVPYDGTEHILKKVIESGGQNFIYTHRDSETLGYYLDKYNLSGLFAECVTADYGFEKKPSPEGVLYIVEKHKLNKDETIMIGDRELDVLSGVGAGTIGGLICEDKTVPETAAKYIFDKVNDVEQII